MSSDSDCSNKSERGRVSVSFSSLARAAYCPRQLYYARKEEDWSRPDESKRRQQLCHRYNTLHEQDAAALRSEPIDVEPHVYLDRVESLSTRAYWPAIAEPSQTAVFVEGRDCHGRITKVLEPDTQDLCDHPLPTLASPGKPPETGVWEPQSVRAVAAAYALSWERERPIEHALVEYPAYGVVRTVTLTTRRAATYRRVLRTVRSMDGPPPRVDDDRCHSCRYRDRCGVKTRSLASLLGF